GRQVEALQDAIALDVGVDDGGDAGILEAGSQLDGGQFGRLRPALDRALAALGVDPDGDPARKLPARLTDQLRIAYGDGAQDDAGDALVQPGLDRRQITNAPAQLSR